MLYSFFCSFFLLFMKSIIYVYFVAKIEFFIWWFIKFDIFPSNVSSPPYLLVVVIPFIAFSPPIWLEALYDTSLCVRYDWTKHTAKASSVGTNIVYGPPVVNESYKPFCWTYRTNSWAPSSWAVSNTFVGDLTVNIYFYSFFLTHTNRRSNIENSMCVTRFNSVE